MWSTLSTASPCLPECFAGPIAGHDVVEFILYWVGPYSSEKNCERGWAIGSVDVRRADIATAIHCRAVTRLSRKRDGCDRQSHECRRVSGRATRNLSHELARGLIVALVGHLSESPVLRHRILHRNKIAYGNIASV